MLGCARTRLSCSNTAEAAQSQATVPLRLPHENALSTGLDVRFRCYARHGATTRDNGQTSVQRQREWRGLPTAGWNCAHQHAATVDLRRDSEWFHVKHRESCAGERERLGLSIPWFRVSPRRPRAQSLSGKTCDAIRPVPTLGTALSAATRGLQQSMAPMVDDQQRMEPRFGTDSSGLAS